MLTLMSGSRAASPKKSCWNEPSPHSNQQILEIGPSADQRGDEEEHETVEWKGEDDVGDTERPGPRTERTCQSQDFHQWFDDKHRRGSCDWKDHLQIDRCDNK